MSKVAKRILENLDVSALRQFSVSTNDSKFDNVSDIIGSNLKQKEMYCITNMPLSDGNYIQSGATHTVLGMEYNNHGHGFQVSMSHNHIKYRKLKNGIWNKWQDIDEEIQEFNIDSYLKNGWSNNGFQIFKKGNVKTLNINIRNGTTTEMMILPEELRPSKQLLFQAINYNLPAMGYIIIATNGKITASSNLVTSNSQNNNCTFNVSYI